MNFVIFWKREQFIGFCEEWLEVVHYENMPFSEIIYAFHEWLERDQIDTNTRKILQFWAKQMTRRWHFGSKWPHFDKTLFGQIGQKFKFNSNCRKMPIFWHLVKRFKNRRLRWDFSIAALNIRIYNRKNNIKNTNNNNIITK